MQLGRRGALACLIATVALGGLVGTPTAGADPTAPAPSAPTVTAASHSNVARPTVSGPVTPADGALVLQAILDDMPRYGYVQDEYFYEGTATAYAPAAPLGADGRWSVRPASTAPYKTRMLVRRPADPHRFNGTVVVEWLNVTAGFDTSPDWNFGRTELMRRGFIWVGISAQYVGVEGVPAGLKTLVPGRYGSLVHPGDIYSYDIYSQAARAIVKANGVRPLAAYDVDHLIADGESQSASRMTTYVNAIAPVARAYDAYLIHSRSAGSSALTLSGDGSTMPNPTFVRTDLREPTLVVESETDVPRFAPARQPDSDSVRVWEIAGTSHVDLYALGPDSAGVLGCTLPVNSGPHHFVFHTAIRDLWKWMRDDDRLPPPSPRIQLDATNAVLRDQYGNALGGIRTPQLDAPAATLSGFGNSPGLCSLFGTTTAFPTNQLVGIYGTRFQYIVKYLIAEMQALQSKFILRDDASAVLVESFATPIPD